MTVVLIAVLANIGFQFGLVMAAQSGLGHDLEFVAVSSQVWAVDWVDL